MRKTINSIEALRLKILSEVDNRESIFAKKPQEWQYSDAGDRYAEATELLREKAQTLESWVEELGTL